MFAGLLVKLMLMVILALGVGNGIQWWLWGRSVNAYKAEVAALKEEAEKSRVREEKKDAEIKHLTETVEKARRKKANVDKKIDQAVQGLDSRRVIELFNPYRVRQPGGTPNPKNGKRGSAGPALGASPED